MRTEITARDRAICDTLRPALREHGLWFVGLDVIGDWLTEINVTSPSAVRQINQVMGTRLEVPLVDWIERRAGS